MIEIAKTLKQAVINSKSCTCETYEYKKVCCLLDNHPDNFLCRCPYCWSPHDGNGIYIASIKGEQLTFL